MTVDEAYNVWRRERHALYNAHRNSIRREGYPAKREAINERRRRYYAENRERIREQEKKSYQKHRQKRLAYHANRRARTSLAPHSLSAGMERLG